MGIHHKILGVSETATLSEIKHQYRKLALLYHPDRGGDGKEFDKITASYKWLCKHHTDITLSTTNKSVSITLEEAFYGVRLNDGDNVVTIPPGIRTGTKIKKGNTLYQINIKKHAVFKRSNDDLMTTITVASEAVMASEALVISGINGDAIVVKLSEITKSTDILSFPGNGMPNPATGKYGDLLVSFIITFK